MGLGAPTFAYRGFTARTGFALAGVVHKRCKENASRWMRKERGRVAYVTKMFRDAGSVIDTVDFRIIGHDAADIKRFRAELARGNMYRHSTPEEIDDYVAYEVKKSRDDEKSLRGQFGIYGWEVEVPITIKRDGVKVFEVAAEKTDRTPPEILRCIESTYNSIAREFG
jgi:hypothetical protein